MRRLLTGYAVTFNHRHGRSGHLFQNRYKSIVCEEDNYLLELIRYIHLNPLRAGQVNGLGELDHYSWCGHAELLGQGRTVGLATDTILPLFSARKKMARKNYRQFVADGIAQGRRPELVGGGLRRSQARQTCSDEQQDYDERVLGSGDFVAALREQGLLDLAVPPRISLEELRTAVANYFEVSAESLQHRSRGGKASQARVIFCYCATRKFNYSGTLVSRFLGMGSSSVSRAVQRGEILVQGDEGVRSWIENILRQ